MSDPLVTIGITCYNAEQTIVRAIQSAIAQDWPYTEIIIVDDASIDASVSLIQEQMGCGGKPMRLVCHDQNQGPAAARNTLVSEAQGEFIVFFDDDDVSLPGRVSQQLQTILEAETELGTQLLACYATGERHYPNGYVKVLPAIGSTGYPIPRGHAVAEYLLLYKKHPGCFYGAGTPTCALMLRRSTLESLACFDPRMRRVEDVDFAIRLALAGGYFIGTQGLGFRQFSTHALDKSPEKNLESELYLVEKHREYLQSMHLYYYAKHWPKLRFFHFKRQYIRFMMELLGLLLRYPKAVTQHFLSTAPRRLWHELRMNSL